MINGKTSLSVRREYVLINNALIKIMKCFRMTSVYFIIVIILIGSNIELIKGGCRCSGLDFDCTSVVGPGDIEKGHRRCPLLTKVKIRNVKNKKEDYKKLVEYFLEQDWIEYIHGGRYFCMELKKYDRKCFSLGEKFRTCSCPRSKHILFQELVILLSGTSPMYVIIQNFIKIRMFW